MNLTKKQSSKSPPEEDKVFKLVQKFLTHPPVIIWGSGATIPYSLPSMEDLKGCLKSEIEELDKDANLEVTLGKIDDRNKVDTIKEIIRSEVLKKNLECLKKSIQTPDYFEAIEKMIRKFYNAHPQNINIVTTNYDCILEYALSQSDYNFTDGFTGRPLSKFNSEGFGTTKIINLIKVHGSLNWFSDNNDNIFHLPCECKFDELKYAMIPPARGRKYQEAFKEPYRTLIGKSDEIIENANSFLVIGFGFNDEHLTPKIDSKINTGTPIVIITKQGTDSCINKLSDAEKYCLFERNKNGTKITFKEKKDFTKKIIELSESYWELNKFMEVL